MSTLLPSGVCGIPPPTGKHQQAPPTGSAGGSTAGVTAGNKSGGGQGGEFDPQKYERSSMKQDEVVALKRLFDACDVENSGVVFLKDLKSRMQVSLEGTQSDRDNSKGGSNVYTENCTHVAHEGTENVGYDSRSDVIGEMVNYFDRDGRTSLNFGQFLDLLSTDAAPFKTPEDIARTFQQFDTENAKVITQKMLTKAAKEFNMLPNLDIVEIIKRADTDGDGKISESEFYYIMEKQTFP